MTPALYPVPPIPVLSVNDQVPVLVASSLREVVMSPVLDKSPSYLLSPTGSVSEPITSLISPSLRTDDVSRPSSGMAPMDQYLPWDTSLLLGESTDFPFLPAPLTSSSDSRDGSRIDCGFPDWGACCCGITEYAGLVSGGPL